MLVSELSGEGVIYDTRTHKAHCLNPTAFAVFKRLDGQNTVTEIAESAGRELGVKLDEAFVEAALSELAGAGLLREAPARVDRGRRRAISQIGLTFGLSVAAPAVWSIVAPTVAEAASATSCLATTKCSNANIGECCGTPGQPAKTCNGGSNCGNNSVNSKCRDKVCK